MGGTSHIFEYLSTGAIGWITNGAVPLAIFATITVLLILASKYVGIKLGSTKHVGKYILKGSLWLSSAALFVSIFTFAYGYRGTPVDATHENITLLDPGNYIVVGQIPIDEGMVFTVVPDDTSATWRDFKQVYAENWQVKTSIGVNNTISIVGYEKVMLFIDKIEIPDPKYADAENGDGKMLSMLPKNGG